MTITKYERARLDCWEIRNMFGLVEWFNTAACEQVRAASVALHNADVRECNTGADPARAEKRARKACEAFNRSLLGLSETRSICATIAANGYGFRYIEIRRDTLVYAF